MTPKNIPAASASMPSRKNLSPMRLSFIVLHYRAVPIDPVLIRRISAGLIDDDLFTTQVDSVLKERQNQLSVGVWSSSCLEDFSALDEELFALLAGHAATAILAAQLHGQSTRKLNTMQGLIELLTH